MSGRFLPWRASDPQLMSLTPTPLVFAVEAPFVYDTQSFRCTLLSNHMVTWVTAELLAGQIPREQDKNGADTQKHVWYRYDLRDLIHQAVFALCPQTRLFVTLDSVRIRSTVASVPILSSIRYT